MKVAVQKGKIKADMPTSKMMSKSKVLMADKKAGSMKKKAMTLKKKLPKK